MRNKKAARRLRENRALNRGIAAANDVVLENLLLGEGSQIQIERSGKYQVDFSAVDIVTGAELSGDYSLNSKGRVTEYTYQTQYGNGLNYYFHIELDGTASAFELHTSAFDDERYSYGSFDDERYYDGRFGDAVDIAVATGNGQPLADLIDSLPGVMPRSSISTYLVLQWPDNVFYA